MIEWSRLEKVESEGFYGVSRWFFCVCPELNEAEADQLLAAARLIGWVQENQKHFDERAYMEGSSLSYHFRERDRLLAEALGEKEKEEEPELDDEDDVNDLASQVYKELADQAERLATLEIQIPNMNACDGNLRKDLTAVEDNVQGLRDRVNALENKNEDIERRCIERRDKIDERIDALEEKGHPNSPPDARLYMPVRCEHTGPDKWIWRDPNRGVVGKVWRCGSVYRSTSLGEVQDFTLMEEAREWVEAKLRGADA